MLIGNATGAAALERRHPRRGNMVEDIAQLGRRPRMVARLVIDDALQGADRRQPPDGLLKHVLDLAPLLRRQPDYSAGTLTPERAGTRRGMCSANAAISADSPVKAARPYRPPE
jgi:hypothetical protein